MTSPKKSDESVKAGADLLLKGWKMLNKACPTCYEPLYEKEGKVVCVRCKTNYVLVDSPSDFPKAKISKPEKPTVSHSIDSFDFSSLSGPIAETAQIMLEKLNVLNTKLKEATDPKEITELSSSIRSIIDSLRSLMN